MSRRQGELDLSEGDEAGWLGTLVVAAVGDVAEGEAWLTRAGLQARPAEELAAEAEERRLAIQIAAELRTRGGKSRGRRLALCGAPVPLEVRGWGMEGGRPARVEGGTLLTYGRLPCRDRLCPRCADTRRRELMPRVEERLRRAQAEGPVMFITLTQRKRHGERATTAIDRILRAWTEVRRRKAWKTGVVGGLRALEVVSRRAGEEIGGYRVRIAGHHAHLHCLVQLHQDFRSNPGDVASWWAAVRQAYTAAAVSDAEDGGLDCQVAGAGRHGVSECTAYVLKLRSLYAAWDRAPAYVREVIEAIEGRRALAVFGSWTDLSLRPASALHGVRWGGATIAALHRAGRGRWMDGEVMPAGVLEAVRAGPAAGIAALRDG